MVWRRAFAKYALLFILTALFFGFPESYLIKTRLAGQYYRCEAVLLVILVLFLIYYVIWKRRHRTSFSTLEIFTVLLLALPLCSAVMAWVTFDQPLYLGILTERRWGMILIGLVMYYLLSIEYIDIKVLSRIFLITAITVICVGILTEINLFNLLAFGFMSTRRFSNVTVAFIIIYCLILFKKQRNWFAMCVALAFSAYPFFTLKGRGFIIGLALTVVVVMVVNKNRKAMWRNVILTGLFFILVLSGFRLASPGKFAFVVKDMSYVLTVVQGETSGDVDTDARMAEVRKVVAHIKKSPFNRLFFGSGNLSRHFGKKNNRGIIPKKKQSFRGIFGYFYPVDIGFVGMIFVYGLLGFGFVNLVFLFGLKYKTDEKFVEHEVFLSTLRYYLVFIFLMSMQKGMVFMQPEIAVVPVFILWYASAERIAFEDEDESNRSWFNKFVNRMLIGRV